MRLIDADELMKDRVENDSVRIAVMCAPTAYDVDRFVERLEERKNTLMADFVLTDRDVGVKSNALGRINEIDGIIEIVESGGIQHPDSSNAAIENVTANWKEHLAGRFNRFE